MKRIQWLFVLLALIVFTVPALADTMYVHTDGGADLNLRDELTNEVIGTIPDGTALTPDPQKSTDLSAYVTYEGQSGFVLWRYLTHQAPDGAGEPEPTAEPAPIPEIIPPVDDTHGEGEFEIRVTGATVSLDQDAKDAGTSVRMSAEDVAYITADSETGIDYWVFNGVRYDFIEDVSSIRVEKPDRSWDIEVVYISSESQTCLTDEEIQAGRTGETLIVRGVHAELSHIDANDRPATEWLGSFNFTKDYQNLSSRYRETGGQISLKVRGVVPWGQYVSGWKFDETEFYPNAVIRQFFVRKLNTCMTYEPIFGSDPDAKLPKVTVTCIRCTFSGGGYSNATYGEVEVGTTITVTGEGGYGSWEVNGAFLKDSHGWYLESYTITEGIYSNTVIQFYLTIN